MYYVNPHIKDLYRTSFNGSRKEYIRLDMNENTEGLPADFFKKVMESITPEYVAMYPETGTLLQLLSDYENCEQHQLCVTNGSDDAIRLLFEAFGEPGKNLVSVYPSFEMYSVYVKMFGMNHKTVNYNKDFEVSFSDFLEAIDENTGIVVLLNPNSPIGKPWTEQEIRIIIEKAEKHQAIVVIDEAYYYFSPNTHISLMKEYHHVIVLRTFSKLLSIAGCRIGYVVSNPEIIRIFKKASSSYPVNSFAIRFAEAILENVEVIDDLIAIERNGRNFLLEQLEHQKYTYHYNQGNYVLIKSKKEPSYIFEKLKEKNILIKIYSQPILSEWIRVTTGSRDVMSLFWSHFKELDDQ